MLSVNFFKEVEERHRLREKTKKEIKDRHRKWQELGKEDKR